MSRWLAFWKPSQSKWLLFLPPGAFAAVIIGILLLGSFQGVMTFTSTNQFCYSCHIGMDTFVEEYQNSSHFNGRSGVAATCADCHIPKEFGPKLMVKIKATADVWHKLTGKITLENYEKHRLGLAKHIWAELKENDSRECRNCHDSSTWDLASQSQKAQIQHDEVFWAENNKTCISCHKGVAHLMPLRPGTLVNVDSHPSQ